MVDTELRGYLRDKVLDGQKGGVVTIYAEQLLDTIVEALAMFVIESGGVQDTVRRTLSAAKEEA